MTKFNFNYRKSLTTGYVQAIVSGISSLIVFGFIASRTTNSRLGVLGLFVSSLAITQFGLSLASGTSLRKLSSFIQIAQMEVAAAFARKMFAFFLGYSLTSICVLIIVDLQFGKNPLGIDSSQAYDKNLFVLFCFNILIFSFNSVVKLLNLAAGSYPVVNICTGGSSIAILLWCYFVPGDAVLNYLIVWTITSFFTIFILLFSFKRKFNGISLMPRSLADFSKPQELLGFHDSLSALLSILIVQEITFIGWFAGVDIAGKFSRNWRYPELFLGLIMKLYEQMYPLFVLKENIENLRTVLLKAFIFSGLCYLVFSIFYYFFSEPLAIFFFGKPIGFEFRIQILVLILLPFMILDKISFNILYPQGKLLGPNVIMLAILLVKVAACVLFTPENFLFKYFLSSIFVYLLASSFYSFKVIKENVSEQYV